MWRVFLLYKSNRITLRLCTGPACVCVSVPAFNPPQGQWCIPPDTQKHCSSLKYTPCLCVRSVGKKCVRIVYVNFCVCMSTEYEYVSDCRPVCVCVVQVQSLQQFLTYAHKYKDKQVNSLGDSLSALVPSYLPCLQLTTASARVMWLNVCVSILVNDLNKVLYTVGQGVGFCKTELVENSRQDCLRHITF